MLQYSVCQTINWCVLNIESTHNLLHLHLFKGNCFIIKSKTCAIATLLKINSKISVLRADCPGAALPLHSYIAFLFCQHYIIK